MKNKIYTFLLLLIVFINKPYAAKPEIPDLGLPWEKGSNINIAWDVWWKLISIFIQYVAVIAVISLMISWVKYLLANWEEEKVKKAKSWIIWSLVWVLLSISAWGLINIINNIRINN